MPQDQPDLDAVARRQTVALLTAQIAAASAVSARMVGSARHVAGANFVMLDHSCDQIARLMDRCAALMAERVDSLGGWADWTAHRPLDATPDRRPALSRRQGAEDAFYAATLAALCQSLLEAATMAEMQGDGPTADLLTRIWREIDRGLWRMVPHKGAAVQVFLRVGGESRP